MLLGKTVDEEALIHALTEKKIFAAGIDTFTQEPIQKIIHSYHYKML